MLPALLGEFDLSRGLVQLLISCMNSILPANGRSIEDFSGKSLKGDIGEAMHNAVAKARKTLASETIEWQLLSLSGTASATSSTVVAKIKAKMAHD